MEGPAEMGGGPASDSRRTSRLLRLLPSRPDRVRNLLSRETNRTATEPGDYARANHRVSQAKCVSVAAISELPKSPAHYHSPRFTRDTAAGFNRLLRGISCTERRTMRHIKSPLPTRSPQPWPQRDPARPGLQDPDQDNR